MRRTRPHMNSSSITSPSTTMRLPAKAPVRVAARSSTQFVHTHNEAALVAAVSSTSSTAEITSSTVDFVDRAAGFIVRRSTLAAQHSIRRMVHGRHTSGFEEPKTATIGHFRAAARCIGPLSLPMKIRPKVPDDCFQLGESDSDNTRGREFENSATSVANRSCPGPATMTLSSRHRLAEMIDHC